jgi:aminoglycoside phosphotransferase (APT) family kinase protein
MNPYTNNMSTSTERSRPAEDPDSTSLEDGKDTAAKYNQRVLRKLQRALAREPDIDITTVLPSQYTSRLAGKKPSLCVEASCGRSAVSEMHLLSVSHNANRRRVHRKYRIACSHHPRNDPPAVPRPTGRIRILASLSNTLRTLLNVPDQSIPSNTLSDDVSGVENPAFLDALTRLIESSKIIFQSQSNPEHYVVQCSPTMVVKVSQEQDSTEFSSICLLAEEKPNFPAPKPHGHIACGDNSYLFMSLMPGVTLESVWSDLAEDQRCSIGLELDAILLDLRTMRHPPQTPLGGVAGEGCKDVRRHVRVSKEPLYTNDSFWEFLYGAPRGRSTVYCRFLRLLTFPPRPQDIVFTHGDIRPANIIVQGGEDGLYHITGIIDWESSGFYPEDIETIRAINNLSSIGEDDWYLYLPNCISPGKHSKSILSDRVMDPLIV